MEDGGLSWTGRRGAGGGGGRAVLEKGTPYLHMNTRSSQPLLQLTWQWQPSPEGWGGAVYAGPPRHRTGLIINHNPWLTMLLCGRTWLTFIYFLTM